MTAVVFVWAYIYTQAVNSTVNVILRPKMRLTRVKLLRDIFLTTTHTHIHTHIHTYNIQTDTNTLTQTHTQAHTHTHKHTDGFSSPIVTGCECQRRICCRRRKFLVDDRNADGRSGRAFETRRAGDQVRTLFSLLPTGKYTPTHQHPIPGIYPPTHAHTHTHTN